MEVSLRRFEQFMAKPQSDHGAIDAGLQQLHRSAVPQHVWRDPLGLQRRTSLARGADIFCQQRLNAVRTEPPSMPIGEQGGCSTPGRLVQPCLDRSACVGGERRTSLFPSFTGASHMSSGAEMDGVPVQADQLGNAQACLGGKQQQSVIAAPSHVDRSGAARIASISGRVRKCTSPLSCRLPGIARTRWI